MRNTRIGIAALAAIAASGAAFASLAETVKPAPSSPPRRAHASGGPRRRYRIKPSGTSHYPEQSDRQALRGQRRAQGGPGLMRMGDGTYVPRSAANAA